MKIIVSGGAGFIGSHVADILVSAGHRVLVIDDLSSGSEDHLNPDCEFTQMDISHPRLARMIRTFQPFAIFHFAAQIDVRKSILDPCADAKQNILNSLNLIETSCKVGAEFFSFASSGGAIYGEPEVIPQSEAHPCNPVSPYGAAKLSIDHYLQYYNRSHGLKTLSLRFANVYGPRQGLIGEAGVVAKFLKNMKLNNKLIVNGDGEQTRDFIYVEDIAEAELLFLNQAVSGVFNIGTGVETSINGLVHQLEAVAGRKLEIEYGPAISGEQRRSVLDFAKAKGAVGWSPRTTFAEGLQKTFEWSSRSWARSD